VIDPAPQPPAHPDGDIVATWSAVHEARAPLIVLDALERFLDSAGIGSGGIEATTLGGGHSNVTFEIVRSGTRVVLRRPPRPPIPPSAHDVLREARLLQCLHSAGMRVPAVLAVCAEPQVIGMPFFVMEHVDGDIVAEQAPTAFGSARVRRHVGHEAVDRLVDLHRVDVDAYGLQVFGRPGGYLTRQLKRFAGIWERQQTRELPEIPAVLEWLVEHQPESRATTFVHGDYRLGNLMYARDAPFDLLSILDWEMATVGDPLADVGYLCATWAESGDPGNPMLELSAATRLPGFESRDDLRARYARRSGRDLSRLDWYEILALWKCAIFLESSRRRWLDWTTDDPYFARLESGVPLLARQALERARSITPRSVS
jgi:aminoglycoside phosphotransferase (APT) family kinase protein